MALHPVDALCSIIVATVFFAGETVRPDIAAGINSATHHYSPRDPLPVQSTSGIVSKDLERQHEESAAYRYSHDTMDPREDLKAKVPVVHQQDGDESLGLRAFPRNALLELNATSVALRSDNAMRVSTFVVEGVSGTGGEVFLDLNQEFTRKGADLSMSREILANLSLRLETTASVFVGPNRETVAGQAAFPVRWYSSSGTEYVVCGHGNLATALLAVRAGRPEIHAGGYTLLQANGYKETYTVMIDTTDSATYVQADVNMGPRSLYLDKISETKQITGKLKGELADMLQATPDNIENEIVSVEDDELAMALIFFVKDLRPLSAPAIGYAPESPYSTKPYRGLLAVKHSGNKFAYRGFYPLLGLDEDKATGSANAFITVALWKNFGAKGPFESQQLKGGVPTGAFTSRIAADGVYVGGRVELMNTFSAAYDSGGGVTVNFLT